MCRSCAERPPTGKRCPATRDPRQRELARIRQRLGRYDRAVRDATEAGDFDAVERYIELLDRDVAAYEELTAAAVADEQQPASRAGEFTFEATVDLDDAELMAAFGELHGDPDAQEAILATLERRDELDRLRDAEIADHEVRQQQEQAERERAWETAETAETAEDASPLTNPARRTGRRYSSQQACREEYDVHTYTAYLDAEQVCRGHLLTKEGEARGIDPLTLFSGPASRARKYASEELKTWWSRNGRITFAEWRYQWFGRKSDKEAATTARQQSIGETTL